MKQRRQKKGSLAYRGMEVVSNRRGTVVFFDKWRKRMFLILRDANSLEKEENGSHV